MSHVLERNCRSVSTRRVENASLMVPYWCCQVVKEAVREATGRAARPVDPREAAKGRLDQVPAWPFGPTGVKVWVFPAADAQPQGSIMTATTPHRLQVQVRDWGSGNPNDLGDLEVESVSTSSPSATEPLYQQLAKRLQTLEVRAAMAARTAGGRESRAP